LKARFPVFFKASGYRGMGWFLMLKNTAVFFSLKNRLKIKKDQRFPHHGKNNNSNIGSQFRSIPVRIDPLKMHLKKLISSFIKKNHIHQHLAPFQQIFLSRPTENKIYIEIIKKKHLEKNTIKILSEENWKFT
jgi:hypothetical protein